MKHIAYIIALGFRVLIFALVFSSIILQPAIKSMAISEPQAFSWLDMEAEHDSSEKESKEVEDSKDKKVELRLIHEDQPLVTQLKRVAIYGGQNLKSDITIDTHNPPPQVI
jgi:hypothetical protein